MLKTGMIIAERYEILGKIGSGGMADVYKAKDHKLNRFVAVKVLKAEFREDTTFIRKFRSEAQAAAGLTHPNIVNVFDVGDDEGVYYIVMELIEGITLKEYISKKGRLSIKEATSIAIQVSMGLEAAHSHGIVHRDVKPQNIIISMDGKVKVTDFGIARAASSNTISSNVMGSVHYSSPEQVRGGYSDEKSDIYSLGITLYEMVTGKVPFDGDTTVAIAIKHLQEEMVPPSIYTPELPNSLEQIIFKCTQKSVDRRYSRMEDVIADLKHSLIDPQGDFVKLTSVDNDAKTVVISDKELGEIKHTPKQVSKPAAKQPEIETLEQEVNETDYEDDEEELARKRRQKREEERRRKDRKQPKGVNHGLTIITLILGAAILIALILVIGRASGLIGGTAKKEPEKQESQVEEDDGMVPVPDLVGKTEAEAAELANNLRIGVQRKGEEVSNQEKGRISSQVIPAGTMVQAHTTLEYYTSKGAQQVTVPDVDGRTGIDARQILEDMGLNVTVQKEYSELDDDGYPIVNPGYAYYTTPDAGSSLSSGDSITLVVSRGVDYGDSIEVPSVVSMEKNEAITTLGKFLDIQVVEEKNSEVPAGQVISQNPVAYDWVDPDLPITITVSTGNQDSSPAESTDNADSDNAQSLAAQQQAAANGEVWKCTQSLNTPSGYTGGLVRIELVQEVNGQPSASVIVDGQIIEFPYDLDITGAPGVSDGILYLSEETDGTYHELGYYPITFVKAE